MKAALNRVKHGVRFSDATEVFDDERAVMMADEATGEDRFVAMGMDGRSRVLVVAYTWRRDNIRIISARKATRRERKQYGG